MRSRLLPFVAVIAFALPFQPAFAQERPKASVTALSVAWAFSRYIFMHPALGPVLLREAQMTQTLCDRGVDSLCGTNWVLCKLVGSLPYALQRAFFNLFVFKNYDERIALRKLWIRGQVERHIREGITQIVIIGGGYDTLSLGSAMRHPGIRFFELDRSPTRDHKLLGVVDISCELDYKMRWDSFSHAAVNDNLHFIECDLSKEALRDVLLKHGFSEDQKTLFIAEGFTMYLNEAQNGNILNQIRDLGHPGNIFLVSFLTGNVLSRLSAQVQGSTNELYQFTPPEASIAEFVTRHGFQQTDRFCSNEQLKSAASPEDERNPFQEVYFILTKSERPDPEPESEPKRSAASAAVIEDEI